MFKCVLLESVLFRSAFEAIGKIVDEIQIQVTNEGWDVRALDNSHTTFVLFSLKPDFFEEYTYDGDLKLNVDMEEFQKVLKRIKKDEQVELEANSDSNELTITIKRANIEDSAIRQFYINLIDLEYEQPKPPELEYPNRFEVGFKSFKNTVEDVQLYSSKITLEYDPEEERLISCGEGDFGRAQIKEPVHGQDKGSEAGKSTFDIEKISHLLKADKFSQSIFIQLGTDLPLTLEMQHQDILQDDPVASIKVLIAPRIESEEE